MPRGVCADFWLKQSICVPLCIVYIVLGRCVIGSRRGGFARVEDRPVGENKGSAEVGVARAKWRGRGWEECIWSVNGVDIF
jgi:hypothetical protein